MHRLCIERGQRVGHIARPPVANFPCLCNPVHVAGSRSRNTVLHHSASRSVAAVLDIGLEMLVAASADCTGCEP